MKSQNQQTQQNQQSQAYTTKQINNFLLKFCCLVNSNTLDNYLSNMSSFLKADKDIEKLTSEQQDFAKTFGLLMTTSKFDNYFSNTKEDNAYSKIIDIYNQKQSDYLQISDNGYYNQEKPKEINSSTYYKQKTKTKNIITDLCESYTPEHFLQQNLYIETNLDNIFKTIELLRNAKEYGLDDNEIAKQFKADYFEKSNNSPWYEGDENKQINQNIETDNKNKSNDTSGDKKYNINLAECLKNVKEGNSIPAFDIDNTLCLANKGIFAFINIFKKATNEKDIENAANSLINYLGKNGNYKKYFTLNLEQIALNYPEYGSVIQKLISSLDDIKEEASCKDVIKKLRAKVESLRKEGEQVPNDLFIAPLANKFINEIKNSEIKDKNVIIASVALSLDSENIGDNDSILAFLHQKFFGPDKTGNLYIPFQDNSRNNIWLQVFRDENGLLQRKKLDAKVVLDGSAMNKAESLVNLNNYLGNKNIVHLDNETRYDKDAENIQFVPFAHKQIDTLEIENYEENCRYLPNQAMPDKEYSKDLLDQLENLKKAKKTFIANNKQQNDLLISFNPKNKDNFIINHPEEKTDIECDLEDKIQQQIYDTNQSKEMPKLLQIKKTQEKAESAKGENPKNQIAKPKSISLFDKFKNFFSCCGDSTVIR